jgi:hypothetical protein
MCTTHPEVLDRMPDLHPVVVFGGQAFTGMRLPETFPAVVLQGAPSSIVRSIEKMMGEVYDN